MLFSEATGRTVVSTSTAETVGRIDDFVVDPQSRSVVALVLKKASDGDILRWPAIKAFGADAVTVTGADRLSDTDDRIATLSGKDHKLLGKRVLTSAGDDIGAVSDVEFNASSGAVTTLHLTGKSTSTVAGARLIGVGSYAVVVRSATARAVTA